MKKALLLVVFVLVCASSGNAQFFSFLDKTVPLRIDHPPQIVLTVKRVAFGQPHGMCSDVASELVDRMVLPDFQQMQVDVIERHSLEHIMSAHHFDESMYAEGRSPFQLGKILGPSALIIINLNTCNPDRDALHTDDKKSNGTVVRTFISKTRYTLVGSVRVVDLTTGQIMGSQNFESRPEQVRQSQSGPPEFAPVDMVKEQAMQDVKAQIHGMFYPVSENIPVVFYDDKDCNLKQAYDIYKNGDRNGATRVAEATIEQCKADHKKDNSLARAYYNAGLLHCLGGEFDAANNFFTPAMNGKGAGAVAKTADACNRARDGDNQMRAYMDRVARIPAPLPIRTEASPVVEPQKRVPVHAGPASADAEERLKKLDSLYKRGLITRREYEEKRSQILGEM